jgi:hypothetical protein
MSQSLKPLMAPFRIGVDIGGTFTDLVMVDAQGQLRNEKVLTTPLDPSIGVLTGIQLILDNNGVQASDVENVIHGTTLVANALIERKGVRTALITTEGFRDVLQIGREWRYDIYDLFLTPVEHRRSNKKKWMRSQCVCCMRFSLPNTKFRLSRRSLNSCLTWQFASRARSCQKLVSMSVPPRRCAMRMCSRYLKNISLH